MVKSIKRFFNENLYNKIFVFSILIFFIFMSVVLIIWRIFTVSLIDEQLNYFQEVSFKQFVNDLNKEINIIENYADKISKDIVALVADSSHNYKKIDYSIEIVPGWVNAVEVLLAPKYRDSLLNCSVSFFNNNFLTNKFIINDAIADSIFQEVLHNQTNAKRQPYWKETKDDNKIIITYTVPIINTKQEFIGIIRLNILHRYLVNILEHWQMGYSSYNMLISESGKILVNYNNTNIFEQSQFIYNDSAKSNSLYNRNFHKIYTIKVDSIASINVKDTYIIGCNTDNGWRVLTLFQNDDIFENIKLYSHYILVALIWILLAYILISYIVMNRIMFPLTNLYLHLKQLDKYDKYTWNLPAFGQSQDILIITERFNSIFNFLKNINNNMQKIEIDNERMQDIIKAMDKEAEKYLDEQISSLYKYNILLSEELKHINSLNELGHSIIVSLSISDIGKEIYTYFINIFPIDYVGIYLFNKESNILEAGSSIFHGKEITYAALLEIYEVDSITVKCFTSNSTIIINNLDIEYSKYVFEYKNRFPVNIYSIYATPINDNNGIIGVFTLCSAHKNIFIDMNIEILQNFKTYLNSAIININDVNNLQKYIQQLNSNQTKLIQNEKLASLEQLAAGISKEIKNPLNFIINFSELSKMLVQNIKNDIKEYKKNKNDEAINDIEEMIDDIEFNMESIIEHIQVINDVIKDMSQNTEENIGEYVDTDINNLIVEYSKLAYNFFYTSENININIVYDLDETIGIVNIISNSISRVITNLVMNSCFAIKEKLNNINYKYLPEIIISSKNKGDNTFSILVRDNGIGIPDENILKIFTPFFTTKKESEKRAGLGLTICYNIIVNDHKGKISFDSVAWEWTEFRIELPKKMMK